jgi:hypothetical protein
MPTHDTSTRHTTGRATTSPSPRRASRSSTTRSEGPSPPLVWVDLPSTPPVLSPSAASVLARILAKAGRTRGVDTILKPQDPEALAS